jgi:threonine dehydratase
MNEIDGIRVPDVEAIAAARVALAPYVRTTPVWSRDDLPGLEGTEVVFKMELLQNGGTFKPRGAFSNLLALAPEQLARGVTCVSAGNHAVAVAYAAQRLGVSAKVVMIKTASPARVALCVRYGAEVVMADDGATAFTAMREIEAAEGRFFVHPFNGLRTILGTATVAAEWIEQAPDLDAVVIPIGGGGLAAGMASAFKLLSPKTEVFGVEPEGAASMQASFDQGGPLRMAALSGIADSLMAPHTEAYSYGLCRQNIDALCTVSDDALREAMRLLFDSMKLAVEPACAASTAALLGPLRARLEGRRVGLLLCGTNTDPSTLARHLA